MSEDEKLLKEAKKLPWEDRLMHKKWKVRNDASIDLAAVCDSITYPKDHRLREYGPFFKKTLADSNSPVQEKALDALIAYLKAADADAGRYGKEVCDVIVAKCLTGRPKTVEKAQTAFMLWVELEAVEAFLDAMEKAIKNKVSKAVVPAIDVMFQALSEFGSKIVPPKRILKMFPELFDHQDENVRTSSKGPTLEQCPWIGKDPVKSILFEKMRDTMTESLKRQLKSRRAEEELQTRLDFERLLKDFGNRWLEATGEEQARQTGKRAEKKELEAELVNVIGTAKPTRKIRSEQGKEPEQEAVSDVAGSGPSEELAADGKILLIPEVIDEYELVDPVDILTPLEKLGFWDGVKASKWSERKGVSELTKLASTKRIALGDFTEICRTLKKLITDVNIAVAVEAIQAIGNLASGLRTHFSGNSRFLFPVLLEKLKEKKPTLKEALTQTLQAMHKAGCLNLADIVEGSADILFPWVGMRPLEKSLEKLDDVRKKKLSEMIGSSGGGQSTVTSTDGSLVRKSAASMFSGKKTVHTIPANKKAASVKSSITKKGDGGGQSKSSKVVEPEDIEPAEMSLEEIENKLGSLIQADTIVQLKSSVWKERLEGMSERVADIKTRTQAIKCLTSFCEAVDPGLIFNRLYKIMKEHKNPKVLSEGILWMISAVEDFGVSYLKLKDLIDFCKDIGLQSSAAATRNSTIKLIGVLHKFIGPDIKAFLTDVKPALLSALDAEVHLQFQRRLKLSDSASSLAAGGLDGLPRKDICEKVTPTLLKGLECSDWKIRLESIETVNKIMEEANKHIQPTGTVELFGALRNRLHDSNKNLIMATLSTIGGLASAMGPAVEKSSKGILSDILKCLDSWLAAVFLDKMVPCITAALTDAKLGAEGRRDLFDWLSRQLAGLAVFSDAIYLLKPSAFAMTDKSTDVRKAADTCFGEILRVCGQEM
ncbi:MOR1 isoform X2, partial [Olea europaea subsp. europaea]